MNKSRIRIFSFKAKLSKYKNKPHHRSTIETMIEFWYTKQYF